MVAHVTGTGRIPRSLPEREDVDPSGIEGFLDEVERRGLGLHSMMLLRHGRVVAEGWWHPWRRDRPHMMFSLSKSFTSAAVGFAVSEGRLRLDDPVLGFFPEERSAGPASGTDALSVRHLITMSTGHRADPLDRIRRLGPNWVHGFFQIPLDGPPGSPFVYNNSATHMLAAIVERVSGQTLTDYLMPRLFEPLAIARPRWDAAPNGTTLGFSGLRLLTEDVAAFGQMLLQGGTYGGRPVLDPEFVAMATRKQVENAPHASPDWAAGYGFQFWMCRHGAFRGDGAYGQFCVVIPAVDAVLAMTSGSQDLQGILDAAWAHLLPALRGASGPLPDLAPRLRSLAVKGPEGMQAGRAEAGLETGDLPLTGVDRWERIRFAFEPGVVTVTLSASGKRPMTLRAGRGVFSEPQAWLRGGLREDAAAAAVFPDDRTLVLSLAFVETPFTETWILRLADGRVTAETTSHPG